MMTFKIKKNKLNRKYLNIFSCCFIAHPFFAKKIKLTTEHAVKDNKLEENSAVSNHKGVSIDFKIVEESRIHTIRLELSKIDVSFSIFFSVKRNFPFTLHDVSYTIRTARAWVSIIFDIKFLS